jgi:PRTRC genetic system ThiF family protein
MPRRSTNRRTRLSGKRPAKPAAKTAPAAQLDVKPSICGACARIDLIGCGGTGAALAELLARAIHGHHLDCRLRIWDGDRVDEANLDRQRFAPEDLGQNKASCLAMRLNGQIGIAVSAVEGHFDGKNVITGFHDGTMDADDLMGELVITCTDNLASRRRVARYLHSFRHIGGGVGMRPVRWWLDVGNELAAGQAILGNTHDGKELAAMAAQWSQMPYAVHVPDAAAINRAILGKGRERIEPSCAAMPFARQALGVNDMAALAAWTLAAQVLLTPQQIRTHAIYFDAAAGRMLPRAITRDLYAPWAPREPKERRDHENG